MIKILPENLRRKRILDLPVGTEFYVTPWSIKFDTDFYGWIDLASSFLYKPDGTMDILCIRRQDNIDVELPSSNYWFTWKSEEIPINVFPVAFY